MNAIKAARPKHGNKGIERVASIVARRDAHEESRQRNRLASYEPYRAGRLPSEDGVDVTKRVGFLDAVDNHGCLWCDGDPLTDNHTFCGKPRARDSRWCEEHYKRVYPGR